MEQLKLNNQRFLLEGAVDIENKKISVVLSEETEVVRYSWSEGKYFITLLHGAENVDLSRKDILGVFVNHNTDELPLAIWENVRLEDRKLKGDAVFDSEDEDSMKIFNKLAKGFLKSFSVGIDVYERVLEKEVDGVSYYNATKWAIHEASVVGIPAIINAKVGLNKDDNLGVNPASAKIENNKQGDSSMEYTKESFEALQVQNAEALSNAVSAERVRVSEILSLNGNFEMKSKAIEEGLSAGECAILLNKANKDVLTDEKNKFEEAGKDLNLNLESQSSEEIDPIQLKIQEDDAKYYQSKGAK